MVSQRKEKIDERKEGEKRSEEINQVIMQILSYLFDAQNCLIVKDPDDGKD